MDESDQRYRAPDDSHYGSYVRSSNARYSRRTATTCIYEHFLGPRTPHAPAQCESDANDELTRARFIADLLYDRTRSAIVTVSPVTVADREGDGAERKERARETDRRNDEAGERRRGD